MSERDAWKEAAIAWEVCASVHEQFAKGTNPFFKTMQADYRRHADEAREQYKKCIEQDKSNG